ncbi:MAG: hypothetical protein P8H59_01580 [Flavobacteriales bacterium]|nr:hypothetical protein [Flavobacteriales bacterium]
MKNLYLCVLAIFVASSANSQDISDQWIKDYLGEEKYELLSSQAPEKLQFYVLLDEEGYSVESIAPKPTDAFPNALEVEGINPDVPALTSEIIESEDFHVLLYKFNRQFDKPTYYRIEGAEGMVLIVRSTNYVQTLFSEE